ncbi:PTS sugar transporter subunit IIA [Solemya velesiana gill symbiont]|uniref:PTS sugar transporter subunit IIA n=1 Tax=Solemya velesiana gill symbiont TaxID=1918948 RepID=A0A1T2KV94_9GAMM|nr:PTS sugar transporter subunit IIA [Solemya velesiana gill symbiont]OOZ36783.1 PTS sugar transporter subunit IIA [Solemya velesiana gill symbiont]
MFPADFLTVERIGCRNPAASKKRVLEEIGKLLATSNPELKIEEVFDKLLERERLGSTGLGNGIGLPHARMAGVEQAVGAFLQLKTGVDYDAINGNPVDLVFGLLVPEEATQEHLQLLAKLASLFSNQKFCEMLRNTDDPAALEHQILHWEELAQSA